MALLKLLLFVLLFILIVLVLIVFGFRNAEIVALDFVFFQTPSISIGFWVLLSFLVGAVLGWLVALPSGFFLRIRNHNIQRKLKHQSGELTRLKGLSPKGR